MVKSEAQLQRLVARAIKRGRLADLFADSDKDLPPPTDDAALPQFSLDHLVRRACIKAARSVLEALDPLIPLTMDENVSISAGEVLRPDFVCINPVQQSIVIFELKKSGSTGRQALTELLAYEQELKNALPLLASYDVKHVLLSSEWSTLMDHAAAGAVTWSNRQLLCVEARIEKKKLKLAVRVPEAWKITGSVYASRSSLPCFTVCVYDSPTPAEDSDKLDTRIWTALEVIAREGDRLGGHGFALLWKDASPVSLSRHNITVCGVAPLALYAEARARGTIGPEDGRLIAPLDRYLSDGAEITDYPRSLWEAAQSARPLLREVGSPEVEGFGVWEDVRHQLRWRADPILCEFWGSLGDYARGYVTNPAVRAHRPALLRNGLGDWRSPDVGLPIMESFAKPEIFFEGEVRCSDAFRLGRLFGLDRALRNVLRQHPNDAPLHSCRFEWNRIELLVAVDELRLLADAAINVAAPNEPFKFYQDPTVDDDDEHTRFVRWVCDEFFQRSPIHILFLVAGATGAILFEESGQDIVSDDNRKDTLDHVEETLRQLLSATLHRVRGLGPAKELPSSVAQRFERLRGALGLKKRFALARIADITSDTALEAWPFLLDLADGVFEPVFHKHAPIGAAGTVDWEWLKQGVREMRKRGESSAGVILLPNGMLVSGRTIPQDMPFFPFQLDDPEHVPFLDRSHGIGFMKIVRWADLVGGTAFERSYRLPD